MSVSTISSYVGNLAIIMLCAITFFRAFIGHWHLSCSGDQLGELCHYVEPGALAGDVDGLRYLDVHLRVHYVKRDWGQTGAAQHMVWMQLPCMTYSRSATAWVS